MADSQSNSDAAAEKAFADAAEKKTADTIKATPASSEPNVDAIKAAVAAEPAKQEPVRKRAVKKSVPAAKVTGRKVAAKHKKLPAAKVAKRKVSAKTGPVKASVAEKPATTISQLKDKIMATSTTDFTAKTTDFTAKAADFTARMQETAAEMQARMKAAYEKGTEMTKEATDFHKGNFEAVVQSGKLLATGMQDMGQTAIESVKSDAETVTDDVKKMAAAKSPTELFQLQGEIARRNLDTLVARTSKSAEAWMKLANEAFVPLSTRASVAMDKMKSVA